MDEAEGLLRSPAGREVTARAHGQPGDRGEPSARVTHAGAASETRHGGPGPAPAGRVLAGIETRIDHLLFELLNLGVPGAAPAAATISLVISSDAGRCFGNSS